MREPPLQEGTSNADCFKGIALVQIVQVRLSFAHIGLAYQLCKITYSSDMGPFRGLDRESSFVGDLNILAGS